MHLVLGPIAQMEAVAKRTATAGALALAVLAASVAHAAEDADGEGWRERPRLTGRWGGRRDRLEERGVDFFGRYTADFWSNLRGGFESGTRYEGFARLGVDMDLGPLLDWHGGRIHTDWISYHGGQPSTDLIGAFATTFLSGWEAEPTIRFYNIFLEQQWLDGRLMVKGGQLAADDDFFVSDYASSLLNATYGFLGLGRIDQIGPFYPIAAPGVYAALTPGAGWFARVGAYVSDVGEDRSDNFGFDWNFENGGFYIGELGLERRPFGRPGRYFLGASGVTASVLDFATGDTVEGKYALYGVIDQALLVNARGDPELGGFLRFQFVPEESSSVVHWYIDGGSS